MWRNFLRWAGTKMIILANNNQNLSDLQWIENRLIQWECSPERRMQLDGERYYLGHHDILKKKRTILDGEGKTVEIKHLPNNKKVDNQWAKMVDQKTNYIVGQPITFDCEDDAYVEQLKKVMGKKKFHRFIKKLGKKCILGGIVWVYPYMEDGEQKFKTIPAHELMPIWKDTEMDSVVMGVRLFIEEKPGATSPLDVTRKVEIYSANGIDYYTFDNNRLEPDVTKKHAPHLTVTSGRKTEERNWERVPLIPFKLNSMAIPLISRAKSLQDAINQLINMSMDNLEEDARNTILVLENYDGQDLEELRYNIAQYAAIKVGVGDGARGDVRTLQIEFKAENYKAILDIFKKALIENCKGYDFSDLKSGSPNQMNIKSIYSDIDLDANEMETEWQASLEELLWFINRGMGVTEDKDVDFIFNRDGVVNETEILQVLPQLSGLVSRETLIAQVPFIDDPQEELKRIKSEEEEAMDAYAGAMPMQGAAGGQNPTQKKPQQGDVNNGKPNK